jgi:hypothetical protein
VTQDVSYSSIHAISACRLGFIDHNEYILVRNSSLDIPAVLKVRPAPKEVKLGLHRRQHTPAAA